MVNPRTKGNFRRLEWIISRVVNVQEEDASVIRRACFILFMVVVLREELRFFFEFRRRVNALAKREGKKTKNEEKCEELFVPGGPMIVLTHSYKLSPFGPALQFVGGSKLISASSFWMRFAAELIPDLLIFSLSFSTTNFMKSLSLSASLSLLLSLSLSLLMYAYLRSTFLS